MAQLFRKSSNVTSKVSIVGAFVGINLLLTLCYFIGVSPYVTRQDAVRVQPVPFSHKHHVGGLGLDCRYCHTSVEESAFAGIPPTKTCMNCHSQIWLDSPTLEPVRESFRTDKSIRWERVHDLPDFVYFNHSIHVAKGVGCESCHGRIDKMPLVRQQENLTMYWCIECHRNPGPNLRPKDQITKMGWQPEGDRVALSKELIAKYHVNPKITCSTCHR